MSKDIVQASKRKALDRLMAAPYPLTKQERIKMRRLMNEEKQQKDSRTLLPEVNYKD